MENIIWCQNSEKHNFLSEPNPAFRFKILDENTFFLRQKMSFLWSLFFVKKKMCFRPKCFSLQSGVGGLQYINRYLENKVKYSKRTTFTSHVKKAPTSDSRSDLRVFVAKN
jgi:hypothetical protein